MAKKNETATIIAEGRELLRQNRIREAFLLLHPMAAEDRDVCELALQLTFPYSRIRQLHEEDIQFLYEHTRGWNRPNFYRYLYAVHLIENRRGPEDVQEAMELLDLCYSNYLDDSDIGDAIYLQALVHKNGWDGTTDQYNYADKLGLAYSDDSQRAFLRSAGNRIFGTANEEPFPESVVEKLREVLHIQSDEDIDEPGSTHNDLQHPAVWGLLSRAYCQMGNEELARRCAQREIKEGLVEAGQLDLALAPCDPLDPLRELSPHDDPEPVASTDTHLSRPWHTMKTYYPPRPEDERATAADGLTEMERRNAFNMAMRELPSREQLRERKRVERVAKKLRERERREKEEKARRLAALKGKPINAIHIEGLIEAVDPGVVNRTPFGSIYSLDALKPGQDLLAEMPSELNPYVSRAILTRVDLDCIAFKYGDKEITLHLGGEFDSGEIGLSYAYARFIIRAR